MSDRSKAHALFGRDAQVDVCPCDAGFGLSIGRVSLWLERPDVEDLIDTLGRALLLAESQPRQDDEAPLGAAPPHDEAN
jgi:hypothetical protein